jgi:hypothetical protein
MEELLRIGTYICRQMFTITASVANRIMMKRSNRDLSRRPESIGMTVK